ncbi:MAG: DUF262 domain-containing protein [Acidobacteria bacterium]|nr:DUF262 domain-containing protein [Acidobacteriota bacterium]
MAVPDFQTLMLPLLKLAGDGQQHTSAEAVESLAQRFQLSTDDRGQLLQNGQPRFNNRVGWATTYLKKAGLLQAVGRGRFEVTDRGRDVLAAQPDAIDIAFLESRFPEVVEFRKARPKTDAQGEDAPADFNADGTWNQREGIEERVRQMMEASIPDEPLRRAALQFLAAAIENADEERNDGWCLRDTGKGLRLMTGRLLACEVARSKMRVSVIGPVSDEVRVTLGSDPETDEEFKKLPGGLLLTFPVEHASKAQELLSDAFNSFVDIAMARIRRRVSLEDHVPEAVAYVARLVGRDLPQPDPLTESKESSEPDEDLDEEDATASREPRVRGRAPIFEHGQRSIASLVSDIEREVIALPDLQRPFVWEDTKVRDLLDSLFVGFPVGTLVLWHTSTDREARALGGDRPGLRATTLVIDGQQRLTSLYSVMRGVEVIDKDGSPRKISIAFRPRDGRFEVADAATVYHGELRDRIEERSRAMSLGTVVSIDTQQLLRAVCGVAFGRARMSAVYRYLRGVDPTTGEADAAGRLERLSQLDDAAKECIEPTPWRDYLLRVQHAGFVSQALIASKNAIVNAYAFYIRGRKAGVPKNKLDELIARWVFGTLLTARYSGSSETIFEQDLARVARLNSGDADGFVRALDDALGETLTSDYWTETLVSALETQKGRAPAALAFRAAQVVLATRALFSDQYLRNLFTPPAHSLRAASEVHHLFPEAWLHARGIRDRRHVNQVANLADTGWHENSVIGARGPADYVPRLREKLNIDDDRWGRLCAEHALPLGWESMEYEEFLRHRRRRMTDIVRVAFRQLGGERDAQPVTPPWFLPGAEAVWQKIAETERALRGVVREVYAARFGDLAASKIEAAVPEGDRPTFARNLARRPAGAEPLSVVDYLYLGQLPAILFAQDVQQEARTRFSGGQDPKPRLLAAVNQIAPVRNEIAHVREIDRDRLLRATVACTDILEMLRDKA